ncbi:hypothetical protein HPB48_001673 [Haemaphysalis longicornis]|uniref:Uncharacterized protein n=1 Tax=Haemaphysalis longicornis TaxID=44386 RepID=A0A9J6GW83_HAELO|nr:hypothetical protein HPB48_001673 [Haemaphysalis longicornis]
MLEVFDQEAIELAGYFEDVYVGRPRRNGMCSARFPPTLWSVYESALDEMSRTNNSVEAWHYGLQQRRVRFTELVGVPALSEERAGPKRNEAQSSGKRDHCYKGVAEAETYNKRLQRILQRFGGTDNMGILEACARSITL